MKTDQFEDQRRRILEGYLADPGEEEEREFRSNCLGDSFDTAWHGFAFVLFLLIFNLSEDQEFFLYLVESRRSPKLSSS